MLNISKSKYVNAMKYCPKLLWLQKFKPEEEIPNYNESAITNGYKVGELAREYFEGSVEVEFNKDNLGQMAEDTQKYIDEGKKYICEATFIVDGLFCSVDILHVIDGKKVEFYEVKASTDIKDHFKTDISFQYYVLKKCGYEVEKACLMYINKNYIRKGDEDKKEFFRFEDMTEYAENATSAVKENLEYIYQKADIADEPVQDLCENCHYCSFFEYCKRDLPKPNVFDLGFGMHFDKKVDMYRRGIVSFSEIESSGEIKDKNLRYVKDYLADAPDFVNKDAVKDFLNAVTYPLYHLDFETFSEAVPPYDGIKPYMQVPFQYSLHYTDRKGGEYKHTGCIAKTGEDPRREIAERLCEDIPMNVCVLAFNKSFEARVLKELAETFPDLSEHLMNIHDNLNDLAIPFGRGYYYNKGMKGSYSIKAVLPSLFPDDPELDYHSLDQIHHGGEAMVAFFDMINMSEEEEKKTRLNLERYCGLDTYAMVKILGKLYKSVED